MTSQMVISWIPGAVCPAAVKTIEHPEITMALVPSTAVTLVITLSLVVAGAMPAAPPQTRVRSDSELPPMSWTCPMHPEVVDDKTGACPLCKMALVPVRLELDWSCPVHTSIIETKDGRCPICRRGLVQVTAAISWTCPEHPEVSELGPGRHAVDGRELTVKRERRPHGDHNPRHGGLFFMAADNTHHLEGTYPRSGVFRVFVYDEYTRSLPLKGITGRAVTRESFDQATRNTRELEAFVLRPSSDGRYLEARLGSTTTLPVEVTAKVRFDPKGPEQRFDFSFRALTAEPAPGAVLGGPTAPTASMSATPATQPLPAPLAPSATIATLLNDLSAQSDRVGALFKEGAYADMYFPALAAKEAALALDERTNQLPSEQREQAVEAVRRIVLAAWLVDLYGDLGNKPKLAEAYQAFAASVGDLKAAYGSIR